MITFVLYATNLSRATNYYPICTAFVYINIILRWKIVPGDGISKAETILVKGRTVYRRNLTEK